MNQRKGPLCKVESDAIDASVFSWILENLLYFHNKANHSFLVVRVDLRHLKYDFKHFFFFFFTAIGASCYTQDLRPRVGSLVAIRKYGGIFP